MQCFIWLTKSATQQNVWRLQDPQVHRDPEDRKELKVITVTLASKVKKVVLEIQVLRDQLDILDQREPLVSKAKREKLEHKGEWVFQEVLAGMEQMGKREKLEGLAPLAAKVTRVTRVLMAILEKLENPVFQGLQERRVIRVVQEDQV